MSKRVDKDNQYVRDESIFNDSDVRVAVYDSDGLERRVGGKKGPAWEI